MTTNPPPDSGRNLADLLRDSGAMDHLTKMVCRCGNDTCGLWYFSPRTLHPRFESSMVGFEPIRCLSCRVEYFLEDLVPPEDWSGVLKSVETFLAHGTSAIMTPEKSEGPEKREDPDARLRRLQNELLAEEFHS